MGFWKYWDGEGVWDFENNWYSGDVWDFGTIGMERVFGISRTIGMLRASTPAGTWWGSCPLALRARVESA